MTPRLAVVYDSYRHMSASKYVTGKIVTLRKACPPANDQHFSSAYKVAS